MEAEPIQCRCRHRRTRVNGQHVLAIFETKGSVDIKSGDIDREPLSSMNLGSRHRQDTQTQDHVRRAQAGAGWRSQNDLEISRLRPGAPFTKNASTVIVLGTPVALKGSQRAPPEPVISNGIN